ncbi:MAG: replication factor C large subunit [Methanomassiliicoccales archaeon]
MNVERSTPWVEKYRPARIEDIVGNDESRKALLEWGKSWQRGKVEYKALLIHGPPGTGKTSSAIALALEMGWDFVEMNASDERSERDIERIARPGASTNSFSTTGDYYSTDSGRRHLIIMDEADNLHSRKDRGGLASIAEMISETKQPIILIANDYYELTRRSSTIRKLCKLIRFRRLTTSEIMQALERVCRLEGIKIAASEIKGIADKTDGDLRAAINDLQAAVEGSTNGHLPPMESRRSKIYDEREGIYHLLQAKSLRESREIVRSIEAEPFMLNLWLEENLLSNSDINIAFSASYCLSTSSMFDTRAKKHSYYRFWGYSYDFDAATYKYGRFKAVSVSDVRFPLALTRFASMNSIRVRRDSLTDKVADYCHASAKRVEETVIPLLKTGMLHSLEFARSMARKLDLSTEDLSVLLEVEDDSPIIKKIIS